MRKRGEDIIWKIRITTCSLALLVTCVVVERVGAADDYDRKTLVGLRGVGVIVENIETEFERAGMSVETLRTSVELRLRQAGIRVLTREERWSVPGYPYLYVNLNMLRTFSGIVAYSLRIELVQEVRLERDPKISILATTWSSGTVGTVGMPNLTDLRRLMGDYVDRFINDYLAANPK